MAQTVKMVRISTGSPVFEEPFRRRPAFSRNQLPESRSAGLRAALQERYPKRSYLRLLGYLLQLSCLVTRRKGDALVLLYHMQGEATSIRRPYERCHTHLRTGNLAQKHFEAEILRLVIPNSSKLLNAIGFLL